METIRFDHLSFAYPLSETPTLRNVDFSVEESEFFVVCGKSGCGKTTLLRQIKKNLMPFGRRTGRVLYYGDPVDLLDDRRSAAEIGFVRQNPDNQIVTDKVWHELAFGLESLGTDSASIRRRVAEMASYFDIQGWFRHDVSRLSGGQKQLLNLASIMVMQPRLLVLDEPTSQLDPIAASEFLQTIRRINRDLGVTIILSEHRLEEAFTMADRVMVMDRGEVLACDSPGRIGGELARLNHPMFHGLPAVTKIYHGSTEERIGSEVARTEKGASDHGASEGDGQRPEGAGQRPESDGQRPESAGQRPESSGDGPLTVREGRLWLRERMERAGVDAGAAKELWKEVRGEMAAGSEAGGTKAVCGEPASGSGTGGKAASDGAGAPAVGGGTGRKAASDGAGAPAVRMDNVWFRYSRSGADILRDLSLKVRRGELYALLGGNGVGKTTALKAVMGLHAPQRGRVRTSGRIAMLPQNPQALFSEITVGEDLLEALSGTEKSDGEKASAAAEMLRLLQIDHLRDVHPYDLSGGEQQRLALGKVLLLEPEILLLDEPTKGLDPFFKLTLAEILKELCGRGIAVMMVSHDIEFCARYADRCAMFFDGNVVSEGDPETFFAGNSFYTTTANRMAREFFPEAVTWEEVAACVRKLK